jgi:hypothetical protein
MDFGAASSLFIQKHVPCLGEKLYGMLYICYKTYLSGAPRAEVPEIVYV